MNLIPVLYFYTPEDHDHNGIYKPVNSGAVHIYDITLEEVENV